MFSALKLLKQRKAASAGILSALLMRR